MFQFAPIFLIGILVLVQVVFILHERDKIRRHHPLVPRVWYHGTIWDDIAYALAGAAILLPYCALGWTNIAWVLLLPLLFFGGATFLYHMWRQTKL